MNRALLVVFFVASAMAFGVRLPAQEVEGVDVDADGWAVADGDCCDDSGQSCGDEAPWVNPGAFDVNGNGIDDDCDGTIDNPPATDCSTAHKFTALTGTDLAQSIDFCQTTTEGPPLPNRTWGVIDAALFRASGSDSDTYLVNFQAAVLVEFGNAGNGPLANATMAALATKTARDANDPGFMEVANGPAWNDVRASPVLYGNSSPSPVLRGI